MFNKIILSIGLLSILTLSAEELTTNERILGIEAGYTNAKGKNLIDAKNHDRDPSFGLKIGVQNDEWRTTIGGDFFRSTNIKYKRALLSFDRNIWVLKDKDNDIDYKPYLGGHGGWMTQDIGSDTTVNGMVYGMQGGLAVHTQNAVDFDFGYRYSLSNIESMDSVDSFTFGVNYLY
ncbi:MAG: hypothetical protein KN64_12625 [Sulfurovum sp. AS07-7]|nr:MAG: hypothetical protein KN64_12625 [Sulfurovum sp. AS07-7]